MINIKTIKDLYIDYELALINWRKYEITDIKRNKIGNIQYVNLNSLLACMNKLQATNKSLIELKIELQQKVRTT